MRAWGALGLALALVVGCGGQVAKRTGPAVPFTAGTAPLATPRVAAVATTTTTTVDPGTLPQTHTLPSTADPVFQAHVQALWAAIVADDPALALPFFFPRAAYLHVKTLANPGADYQNRLIAYFNLDIHAAHRLLGADAPAAQLGALAVPTARAVWVPPGAEANRIPYYRVYGTRLQYTEGGRSRSFGIFSLISWRGEWYVVHLGPNPRAFGGGEVYQPSG